MLHNYSDFVFDNHPSILSASKIVISEGLQVHRIVLRQEGNDYIVHRQLPTTKVVGL